MRDIVRKDDGGSYVTVAGKFDQKSDQFRVKKHELGGNVQGPLGMVWIGATPSMLQ